MVYIIIAAVAGLVIGVMVGTIVTRRRIKRKNTCGLLKAVYDGEDNQTYLFLELNPDSPPASLRKRSWVIFDVDMNPHE